MRLLNYQAEGEPPRAGVLHGERILSLEGLRLASVKAVLEAGEAGLEHVRELLGSATAPSGVAASEVRILPPLADAGKLIFIGLNYKDHAAEANMALPTVPAVFSKFSNAVIGPGDAIVLPKTSTQPDYEVEFAFVIGKRAKHVAAEDWREYVAGYTIINDVSARDLQLATSQWIIGKTCDTFCPMGPYVVTADEVGDPHNLKIELLLNGEAVQSSNTRELIFKIPDLVAYLSAVMTLEPGDLISTGTPAGVGFGKQPPRWLRPGDECVARIEKLGELRNPVVNEA